MTQCFYPFKRYLEYYFSPGGVSMMSHAILRLFYCGVFAKNITLEHKGDTKFVKLRFLQVAQGLTVDSFTVV